MTCDRCQKTLSVGDFPFCPHESGRTTVIGDDVPGGFWAENGFDAPRKFYSKSEHAHALAIEGKEIRAKWAGPADRHLTRWSSVSPDTLRKAAELVSRPRFATVVAEADRGNVTLDRADLDETFHVEPER